MPRDVLDIREKTDFASLWLSWRWMPAVVRTGSVHRFCAPVLCLTVSSVDISSAVFSLLDLTRLVRSVVLCTEGRFFAWLGWGGGSIGSL